HGAALVARALDTLAFGAARRAARVGAGCVSVALDAQPARQVADGLSRIAVGGPGAGQAATPPPDVAGARVAVGVDEALDAAAVAQVAHAARAGAGVDALDAAPRAERTARPVRRAVAVDRALDAAPAALAGRAPRLDALGVDETLHTQAELDVAAALRLACAVAGLAAAL